MRSKSPIFRTRKTHVNIYIYITKQISKIILVEIPGSESVSLCGGDKPLWRISPPQNHQGYSFIRHNMPCVFHILTSLKVVSAKEKKHFQRWTCTSKNVHTPMKLLQGRTWNQPSRIFSDFSTTYY